MNLLQIENITITVSNNIVCRDLSFKLQPGDRLAILGPNGSGKTSLLRALANLHAIHSGKILLNRIDLANLHRKYIARSIGILFQDFFTNFPQTVAEYCSAARFPHLAYFQAQSKLDKQMVMDALQLMELDHLSSRQISELSGGEKRRLAIASLLSQNPSFYLLDEPTNHLDLRFQIRVLKHFYTLCETKKAAMIMALHDPTLAQNFCDRVLLLFPEGESVYGPSNDVLTKQNLTRLYQHTIDSFVIKKSIFWYPSVL